MPRRHKAQSRPQGLTRKRMITFGAIAAVASAAGYVGLRSMIPVNGSSPAFALPANHYIKASHDVSGYVYVSLSSGSVKGVRIAASGSLINPTYIFHKDELESIHFINEDYDTHSEHNLNIDEFNVHTHNLKYFESQTITFIADKQGTYHYYCTIHPEMKGDISIEQ